MIPWIWAIYVSVLLWLAVAVGNIALFALRPAEHWPVLETIEGLQTASLIPIALLLHRINRRSRKSAVVTVVGTLTVLLDVVISFAFASELLTFGTGMIAVFGGILAHTRLALDCKRPSLARPGSAAQFGPARHGRRHHLHPSLSRLGAVAGSNPAASGWRHALRCSSWRHHFAPRHRPVGHHRRRGDHRTLTQVPDHHISAHNETRGRARMVALSLHQLLPTDAERTAP
jgi:hypothetical protein